MTTITALPTAPSRDMQPDAYVAAFNAWIAALPTFIAQANALAAGINSQASGNVYAMPFTVDLSSTADADPGSGKLRFNNATESSATVLYVSQTGSDSINYNSLIQTFGASSSTVKGQIRIALQSDQTKFMTFDVYARVAATGYFKLTVVNTVYTTTNPFSASDAVVMFFQRTGDVGSNGTLVRRTSPFVNPSAVTPDVTSMDAVAIKSLAGNVTLNNPTGSPSDLQTLEFRIKDNGTSRLVAYGGIYRAGTDLPLPTATIAGKVLYIGFQYNADDSKWDLTSVANV